MNDIDAHNKVLTLECWFRYRPFLIFEDIVFDLRENISLREKINNFFEYRRIRNPNKRFYYLYYRDKIVKKLDSNMAISELSNLRGNRILLSNDIKKVPQELPLVDANEETNVQKSGNLFIFVFKKGISKATKVTIIDKNINNDIKSIFLLLIEIFLSVLIISFIILLIIQLFTIPPIPPVTELIYEYEILKADITYKPGGIYLFKTNEKTIVKTEGKNISKENSTTNFGEYKSYLLMIQEEHEELTNISNKIFVKYYYTGIFSQINNTIENETHLMLGQSDDNVNNILNKKSHYNLRRAEIKNNILDYTSKDSISCEPFFKLDFYRNGNIKNIYIPEQYNISNMINMKSMLNISIPQLSLNLFVDDIEKELNKIINIENKNDEEEEIEENKNNKEEEMEENKNNEEEEMEKNKNINFKKGGYPTNRNLNEESYISEISTIQESNNDIDLNFDLMQSNILNSSDNQTINQIKKVKYGNINNEYLTFSGSQSNSSIIYIINENIGRIENIQQIQEILLSNQTEDSSEENLDINTDNAIKYEDLSNMTTSSPEIESSSFIVNKINNINCSYINDTSIFDQLKKHFDSFKYVKFDEEKYNDINLRLLSIKKQFVEENNLKEEDITVDLLSRVKVRQLEESVKNKDYYGLTRFTNTKETYKYIMMGLNLIQKVSTQVEPSNGKIKKYIDVIMGKVNVRIDLPETQSNLNIIIQNSNQLSYKLIELIINTNNNLTYKNNEYIKQILEMEKNTTYLLTNYEDFSNILKEPLNNMYSQVKNFTCDLFQELIYLIKNAHYNYTLILNNINEDKYNIFNEIREITKYEYINFINNMTIILEKFYFETLYFLNNTKNELNNINNFLIDVLYDIIYSINDCIDLFEQYDNKLFLSIEKGITNFKYELNQFIENLIGELLYIADFLSINLNKNEIIRNSLGEEERNEATNLLKDFRYIINIIVELLINDIHNDYKSEISISNKNSIKRKTKEKIEQYISAIKNKSEDLINEIKKNINFINQYELYSNNLDTIESINNKTLSEFNFDIYHHCIKNIINIKPEFYQNENADILQNKKRLFNLANDLKDEINNEISDINKYIYNFSKDYFSENLFKMHTDIYYFRKNFFDNEIKNLLNEFEKIVNYTITVLFKNNIKYNFNLGTIYLNEELSYLKSKKGYWHYYSTTGFMGRVNKFFKVFENYITLTQSEEFLSIIEKYFYKIKDDILGYIDEQIKSINKYYFDIDLYKDNFYYIKQNSDEIYKISNNINNFFNSIELDAKIKINAIQLSTNTLVDYNNDLTKSFSNLYSNVMSRGSGSPRNRNEDFEYWRWRYLFFGWKKIRWNCPHIKNINKVKNDLKDINDFFLENTNKIIDDFKNRFKINLINYVNCGKTLYDSLYNYTEYKINNNSNINLFIEVYENLINDTINKNSNFNLMANLFTKYKLCSPNIIINNLENNINLIKEKYYSFHYLKNKSEFLEYPKEIIPKINELSNQLIKNKDLIKDKLNSLYKSKILHVINIYNTFINDFNSYNIKYMFNTINTSYIMDNYTIYKFSYINETFNEFNQDLLITNNELNNQMNSFLGIDNQSFIFNDENYENPINNIINNFNEFVELFENEINNTFIEEVCEDSTEICVFKKYRSELKYSDYNFNIVKLRNSFYYTKNTIKNLYNLFNDYNFNEVIDNNIIIIGDKIFNDKNILQIIKESNEKIKNINLETDEILKEGYDYFIKDISNQYSFENDYLPFTELFKEILNCTYINYLGNITEFNNVTYSKIDELLLEFNETLYKQLNLINNYDYYNINKSYFQNIEEYYRQLMNNSFTIHKNYINNLNYSYNFKNVIKDAIKFNIDKKIEYYKNTINKFAEAYKFKFFNYSFNLGEYAAKYMRRKYVDYIFKYIYEYVELYENNLFIYINNLLFDLNELENNIYLKFEHIYNNFYEKFIKNITDIITYDYIKDLNTNKTFCSNYTMDKIEEYQKEDEINYEKYKNYTFLINETISKCNKNNSDFNENNTINCNISEIEEVTFNNKTSNLLFCHENNYFTFKVKIFEDFELNYKNNLNEIVSKISNIIENRKIDEFYLFNFLIGEISFDKYNFTLNDDIKTDFNNFEDLNFYINNMKYIEYREQLEKSLILNYNLSYNKYINDYIIDDILSNLNVIINEKILTQINYLENKIVDDFEFYKLLISNMDSLGKTTKLSFLNMYENLNQKINETLEEQIEYFFYDLDIFYKNNKQLFRNNYLNSLSNKEKKNIYIYKLDEYLDDIIKELSFNSTLDNIAKSIFSSIFSEKIKNMINDKLYPYIQNFLSKINFIKNEMELILNQKTQIEIPNDMNTTINLINEYNELMKNQNKKFLFLVSDKPFLIINDFIYNYLEPPLIKIKNQYNLIEVELLKKITEELDKFPDYSLNVQNNLDLDSKISNISENMGIYKEYLLEYFGFFMKDINEYFNKLAYLTIINGTGYLKSSCNLDICSINSSLNEMFDNYTNNTNYTNYNNFTRRLNENNNISINKYFRNIPKLNKTISYSKRNLQFESLIYDSESPPLSKDDITFFYLFINNSLNDLTDNILSQDFINLNLTHRHMINKLENIILPKLKKSVDFSSLKFSTLFTKDNYNVLLEKINYQYNKINSFITKNFTVIINEYMNQFMNSLNNTSTFMEIMNSLGFNRIMEISEKLEQLIYEKIALPENLIFDRNPLEDMVEKMKKSINDTLWEYQKTYIEFLNSVQDQYNKAQISLIEIEEKVKEPISRILDIISFINDTDFNNNIKKYIGDKSNYDFNLLIEFNTIEGEYNTLISLISFNMHIDQIYIPFKPFSLSWFPLLQVRFNIYLYNVDINLNLKLNLVYKDENKYLIDMKEIEVLANVEVSLLTRIKCEAGLFIPIGIGEMYIAFGANGLLANTVTKMALYFNLMKNYYLINLKFRLIMVGFDFYLKIGIEIDLKLIHFKINYYLFYILIPLVTPIEVYFNKKYSFRNKMLENSSTAKISLFGVFDFNAKFIPNLIDSKLFNKFLPDN